MEQLHTEQELIPTEEVQNAGVETVDQVQNGNLAESIVVSPDTLAIVRELQAIEASKPTGAEVFYFQNHHGRK